MNPDASQNESVADDGGIDRLSRLFARAGTWSYDYLAEDPLEASTVTVTGMGALWLRLST